MQNPILSREQKRLSADRMSKKIGKGLWLTVALLLLPSSAYAQCSFIQGISPELNEPASPASLKAGDDFATDVLGNPWDFNERRDFAWEQNFVPSSVGVSSGLWSGQSQTASDGRTGFVMPLFAGPNAEYFPSQPLPGDNTLPQSGLLHRLDPTKYYYVSFLMNHTSRSDIAITWDSNVNRSTFFQDANSSFITFDDSFFHFEEETAIVGPNIYSFDLFDISELGNERQGSWMGDPIYQITIDPSVGAANGSTASFDWIRIVDPNSAPTILVEWSNPMPSSFSVMSVYVDTDDQGYDGVPIARFPDGFFGDPEEYEFPSAALPPGTYYFYVQSQEATEGSFFGTPICSNYSAAITINAKPTVVINSPAVNSGQEYAATVRNDAWDFNSLADVPNTNRSVYMDESRNFSSDQIVADPGSIDGGTIFSAIADPAADNGQFSDETQLLLQTNPARPIDPGLYRYLVFRIRPDSTSHPAPIDKLNGGIEASATYFNRRVASDAGETGPVLLYEDWHTYVLDLYDITRSEGQPWFSFLRIPHLQLNALDPSIPANFAVDFVRLHAENRPTNNVYNINLTIGDSDGAANSLSVAVYYDTNDVGFDGTLITSLSNQSPGDLTIPWNMSSLSGTDPLYVYVEVSDGTDVTRRYATAPVYPGTYTAQRATAPVDYDGDGRSDQTVYRNSEGRFYQNRSNSVLVYIQWVIGDQYVPIQGDFDGDGITDFGLVFEHFGYLAWYVAFSSTNTVYVTLWGFPTDQIAVADYNGNGRDEVAVFRDGVWFVLDENEAAFTYFWGEQGDIALPKDFDRDGRVDLAIWRPSDGMWWILNSGFSSNVSPYATVVQWGLPGDIPVPGKWFNSSHTILGVFRPSTGMWFIRDQFTDEIEVSQWGGFPQDMPVLTDTNGDGRTEATIYRQNEGNWYHNYGYGLMNVVQTGLPGDILVANPR